MAVTKTTGNESLPYCRRDFLTKAERSFFGVLQSIVQNQHLIFAKVRLADLVSIRRGTTARQSHFNRIQSKHVDFVLCDPATVKPMAIIELDDSSHTRKDRKTRDDFVDAVLVAAEIPIVRIPTSKSYNPDEISSLIAQALANN